VSDEKWDAKAALLLATLALAASSIVFVIVLAINYICAHDDRFTRRSSIRPRKRFALQTAASVIRRPGRALGGRRPVAAAARHAAPVPGCAAVTSASTRGERRSGIRRSRPPGSRAAVPISSATRWRLARWPPGISIFELARVMGTSVKVIDGTYGHLARDSEQAIRAPLDARSASEEAGSG
jgi:hypothetical protein